VIYNFWKLHFAPHATTNCKAASTQLHPYLMY